MAVLAAGLVAAAASTARAYVRARTDDTFVPFYWRDPGQVLEVSTPPDGLGISTNDLRTASQAAVQAWSYPQISCTAVSLSLAPETSDSQVAGLDGVNRIIMRVGAWCRDPAAMTHCHNPEAVALTTIFTQATPGLPEDGQMLEADIEVNAYGYSWALIPDGPISGRDYFDLYDLTSVLTHESGHFIGLAHNCWLPGAPILTDDQGVVTPDCDTLPPGKDSFILDATMYPLTNPGDVKLRTLTADDKRASCEIYPLWSAPLDDWAGGGACQIAASSPSPRPWPALALLAAVCVALARVRARRR